MKPTAIPEGEPDTPSIGSKSGEDVTLVCYIEDLDLGGQDRVNAEVEFQKRKRAKQKVRPGFR